MALPVFNDMKQSHDNFKLFIHCRCDIHIFRVTSDFTRHTDRIKMGKYLKIQIRSNVKASNWHCFRFSFVASVRAFEWWGHTDNTPMSNNTQHESTIFIYQNAFCGCLHISDTNIRMQSISLKLIELKRNARSIFNTIKSEMY